MKHNEHSLEYAVNSADTSTRCNLAHLVEEFLDLCVRLVVLGPGLELVKRKEILCFLMQQLHFGIVTLRSAVQCVDVVERLLLPGWKWE